MLPLFRVRAPVFAASIPVIFGLAKSNLNLMWSRASRQSERYCEKGASVSSNKADIVVILYLSDLGGLEMRRRPRSRRSPR